ncbi:hypothetical protein ACFQ2B_40070 [Streptomyces stramineus]
MGPRLIRGDDSNWTGRTAAAATGTTDRISAHPDRAARGRLPAPPGRRPRPPPRSRSRPSTASASAHAATTACSASGSTALACWSGVSFMFPSRETAAPTRAPRS